MPYENTWEPRGVVKRFWGHVTGSELLASVEDVAGHRRFEELRYIINDWLAVESHSIDADSLERIAALRLGSLWTNPNIRVAMLTTDRALAALADNAKVPVMRGTQESRSFATLEEGRTWLAQQPDLHNLRGSGG